MKLKKTFLPLCIVFILTLSIVNSFAMDELQYDYSQQLTEEKSEGNVTRGEFTEYLSNFLRKKGILINCENELAFSDIALTHPYYKDIIYLKRLSIIKGVGNDKFRPDDNITFQEVAAMFSRIFLTDSDINMKYGPYPEGYIKYALNSGLFEGIPANGEGYITHNDTREIIKKLEGYFITYDLIEKLGCDAYNGEVYIDYYPKSWQGYEEEPVAATNGYFRIMPGKLLYSYDNENWHTLYEDINGKRVYSNLPENVDISGARYEWAYDCFVNAPFDVNKSYYSYDNKTWSSGEPKNAEFQEMSLDIDEFVMGIKKERILYDSDSGLYFSWQPYYESPYYSQIHKTVFTDIRYNVIWVSDDAKKWIAITPPDDMVFFTNAGLNRGADRKANGIIINGAVNFNAEEKAFLDNEEKIAAELGLDYDKPMYKTEKYILHFSDIKKLLSLYSYEGDAVIPYFNGPEYTSRLVVISDLQANSDGYIFANSRNTNDKSTYVINGNTYVYITKTTVGLNEIKNGMYALCWYYTDDSDNIELLKIEVMREPPMMFEQGKVNEK